MPSSDPGAKEYETQLAEEFGNNVSRRRRALNLTASELARRTVELGYPISRGAIAKIESNSRSGKIDVAELLVLAAALNTPPLLLLFSRFPSGRSTRVLPDVPALHHEAVRWMSGRISFPQSVGEEPSPTPVPPNDGVKLIATAWAIDDAIAARIPLVNALEKAASSEEAELARRTLRLHDEQIVRLRTEAFDARRALWSRADSLSAESTDDDSEIDEGG